MDEPSELPLTEEKPETTNSSWWGSFYHTAKKKLAETNEFMQRDISEFTQVVQNDAAKLVSATTTTMKEKLNIDVDSGLENAGKAGKTIKNSLSNFIGTIQHSVGPILPGEDENDDSSVVMGTTSGVKVLSPAEARLMAVQSDPATFCNEPDSEAEFQSWSETFKMENVKGQISELMLDCVQIRALYTKLVPNAVSHFEFWTRYFYKLHLHEKNEIRRIKLVERAEQKDDISWEDEDDWVHPKECETQPETKQAEPEEDVVKIKDIDTDTTETIEQAAESNKDNACLNDQPTISIESEEIKSKEMIKTKEESEEKKTDNKKPTTTTTGSPTSTNDKSSSEVSSDDWEKEFDLEMTEEEIKEALETGDQNESEDWESWE